MSSVIQTTTRNPRQIELPPRQLTENLESVLDMAHRAGHGVTFEAETTSAIEWSMDQSRAAKMRDALLLNKDEYEDLLCRFRQRNKEVWGSHSKTD